jgi:hypothetical protein
MKQISYVPIECNNQDRSIENQLPGCDHVLASARFEKAAFSREEAAHMMLQTFFVCILLGTMAVKFQNDTQALVIAPIEKMVRKFDFPKDFFRKKFLGVHRQAALH